MTRRIIFLLFFVTSCYCYAQSNYQLLWRISGNGLDQPSYLFGTMHVHDEAAYNFSDSVLVAFQSAGILAKEISRSDVMFRSLQNASGPRSQKQAGIKQEFDSEEYEGLKKAFFEKTKLDLEKFENTNPMFIEMMMRESQSREGKKMPFIIDDYFEEIGLRLGKTVVGLEDPEAGIRRYQGFTSPFEKELFKMRLFSSPDSIGNSYMKMASKLEASRFHSRLEAYNQGEVEVFNLEDMEEIMNHFDMVQRNEIMLSGLDTLMHLESVFCAVGVSHLPGEKGLISLLRESGYEVNAVSASFTGVAKKKMREFEKVSSGRVEKLLEGYRVKMDGPVEEFPIPNTNITMLLHQNLVTSSVQMAMVFPESDLFKSPEKKMEQIIEGYRDSQKMNLVSVDDIIHNGIHGRELMFTGDGLNMWSWLFSYEGIGYLFLEVVPVNISVNPSKSEFFKSIQLFPISNYTTLEWRENEFERMKMKVIFPQPCDNFTRYENVSTDSDEMMTTHYFQAIDRLNNLSATLMQYYYPAGYRSEGLNFAHGYMLDIYKVDESIRTHKVDTLYRGKVKYIHEELAVADTGYIHIVTFLRGQIVNNLILQTCSLPSVSENAFLHEWELYPWENPQLEMVSFSDFDLAMAGEHNTGSYKSYLAFIDSSTRHSSFDLASGLVSDVYVHRMNDLAYFPNSDSLINYFLPDTSLFKVIEPVRKLKDGFLYRAEDLSIPVIVDGLVTWKGQRVFELTVETPLDAATNFSDSIFSSLEIKELKRDTFDILTSKTGLLLEQLFSADTTTYERALGIAIEYPFSPSEADSIIVMLKEGLAAYDENWEFDELIYNLFLMGGMNREVNLEELFSAQPIYQGEILEALGYSKLPEALALYRKLFSQKTTEYNYQDIYGYTSHIKTIGEDFDSILEVAEKYTHAEEAFYILEVFLHSYPEYNSRLASSKVFFVNRLRKEIEDAVSSKESYPPVYLYNTLVNLSIKAGAIYSELEPSRKLLSKIKNSEAKALARLIEFWGGSDLKSKVWKEILSDPDMTYQLLQSYSFIEHSRLNEVISAEERSEIWLENALYFDDYPVENIEYIESFDHEFKEKKYNIHLLHYTDPYEGKRELGICVYGENGNSEYYSGYIEADIHSETVRQKAIEDFEKYYVQ